MNYFAIYWTFPAPWAGFASLGDDVDEAARKSRTISYQRDQIRRHARKVKRTIVVERAFLERAPDRGSVEVADEIAAAVAKRPELKPIMVDFGDTLSWRPHHILISRMRTLGADLLPADEDSIIDGARFHPAAHFQEWNRQYEAHIAAKPEHRARILQAVQEDGADAEALNGVGLRTHTGKLWTRDNLRKFLKAR
ncbi:hypothetical protein [Paracoccus litorisediminis]|uniref:Uncharacterized protein n=1 Tax=Paracoccus litorisediminis TaxID=2006130 RepID=A0A844HNW9_9RHOB|nr:hypothetical protein [Paracoccus litorisediminis]MTH60047.1 hypothetical protein [Paracoccus litorisediminis]